MSNLKQLTGILFATMSIKEIENLLDGMFEAYLDKWELMESGLGDKHLAKRLIRDILTDLHNSNN